MHAWCQRGIHIKDRARKLVAELDKESVKKVLVIRHAALGDMIITRPFLVELRKLFPNALIVLDIASQYQVGVPHELVDLVHITYGQDQRDKGIISKFRNFKDHCDYDLIFDLANTSRSQWITRLNKAKLKLGFPHRKMNFLYDVSILRSDFKFEAETLLDFLCLFGAYPEYPLNFQLPQFLKGIAKGRVAYFLGASIPEKCYPQGNFSELIDMMSKEYPEFDHCILQGVKADEKYESLKEYFKERDNVEVTPLMSIEKLISWMSETNLLISNDTGVRNLAIATHTPTFGIFFEAIPYRYWPRYENIHEATLCTSQVIESPGNIFEKVKKLLREL